MKMIGIVGSRRRDRKEDHALLSARFQEIYKDGDRIVSGGCLEGGDRFAELIARKFQVPILIHYAQWKKHGKKAGFMRNTDIAQDCDVLIALVSKDRTGGTEDTISKAMRFRRQVILT